MPRKTGRGKARGPTAVRRVSELERDVSALSMSANDAAIDEPLEALEETHDPHSSRMQTRQDAHPERKQTLQRLMAAIREGEFDDLDDSAPTTRRKTRGQHTREAHDSDYEQNTSEEEDADLHTTEKRLILKFKTAEHGRAKHESRLEDIDWSEFDLETIHEILERREALRRRKQEAHEGERVTTGTLKKSSLAPPPLQLDRVRKGGEEGAIEEEDEYEDEDEEEEVLMSRNVYEMDVDAEEPEFSDLFEDAPMPTTPGASLHLPRASTISEVSRPSRPHPALIRTTDTSQTKDMRLVLQYELRSEEIMLKDLRAEISDKLQKMQAEERLLRMVVKRDFELPEEDEVEEEPFGFEAEAEMSEGGMDEGHESDGSLSGMSSSSSEDDVQSDELTRGALSQMLRTYLPSEMDTGS
ncbi:hypothetical protein LPJ77_004051 [Coemansia sp. RSA 2523]|nr:hypothetical protein LPJ54_003746 [Coemansia sp. RSA 1824]KAJ1805723.1 hypothetical protein LPJ77_004051 [Coemansia sp. RSA 2523]KAJ2131507.1 hypothetical protein GGF48_001508 [Coemansia sp. RSA 921]KAJ2274973.1 hypothetical protein EV176_002838 [Coemansia sp. RSA 451]